VIVISYIYYVTIQSDRAQTDQDNWIDRVTR